MQADAAGVQHGYAIQGCVGPYADALHDAGRGERATIGPMAEWLYLDAPCLIYRAFFGLPPSMRDPDGRAVNAVRGFLDMLARLVIDRRPAGIVAAFDADWRPASRVAAYAGYKAARPEDPPELPRQFGVITELLDLFGIPRAEAPDLEADDALATLAARVKRGDAAWIVTGDRDLLSLVRDGAVSVLFTVKGVSDLAAFDEAAVKAKYGVAPERYTEFAMMRGDSSDGLPGVAGIGPVRAAKLLETYGSIDAILEHTKDLPKKQAEAFEAARGYLAAMRSVVPMHTDAAVHVTAAHPPDRTRLRDAATRHGVTGPASRLLVALGGEPLVAAK